MKAAIIYGSPRKKGNTAALLEPFMRELEENGVELDYFDVYEKILPDAEPVWFARRIIQELAV